MKHIFKKHKIKNKIAIQRNLKKKSSYGDQSIFWDKYANRNERFCILNK